MNIERCSAPIAGTDAMAIAVEGWAELVRKGYLDGEMLLREDLEAALLREDAGRAIAILVYSDQSWDKEGFVVLAYVRPEHRRCGYLRALWAELVAIGRERGWRRIVTETNVRNEVGQVALCALGVREKRKTCVFEMDRDKEKSEPVSPDRADPPLTTEHATRPHPELQESMSRIALNIRREWDQSIVADILASAREAEQREIMRWIAESWRPRHYACQFRAKGEKNRDAWRPLFRGDVDTTCKESAVEWLRTRYPSALYEYLVFCEETGETIYPPKAEAPEGSATETGRIP